MVSSATLPSGWLWRNVGFHIGFSTESTVWSNATNSKSSHYSMTYLEQITYYTVHILVSLQIMEDLLNKKQTKRNCDSQVHFQTLWRNHVKFSPVSPPPALCLLVCAEDCANCGRTRMMNLIRKFVPDTGVSQHDLTCENKNCLDLTWSPEMEKNILFSYFRCPKSL